MKNPDSQDNQPGDDSLNEVSWRLARLRLKQVELTTEKLASAVGTLSTVVGNVSAAVIEQLDSIKSLGEVFESSAATQDDLAARVKQLEQDVEELKRRFPKAS